MSETPDPTQPVTPAAPQAGQEPAPAAPPAAPPAPNYGGAPPAPYGAMPGTGQIGKVRGTGVAILLYFVTLGIYGLYWWYVTHDEMKRHNGQGIGGVVALILAFFVGIVMPYITSNEVGALRERAGQEKKVSAATGLWWFPGALILIGPFVWFIKTNGALNDYWRSQGATG